MTYSVVFATPHKIRSFVPMPAVESKPSGPLMYISRSVAYHALQMALWPRHHERCAPHVAQSSLDDGWHIRQSRRLLWHPRGQHPVQTRGNRIIDQVFLCPKRCCCEGCASHIAAHAAFGSLRHVWHYSTPLILSYIEANRVLRFLRVTGLARHL